MGSRVGSLIAFGVVLAAGIFLGSGLVEWIGTDAPGTGGEVPASPDLPGAPPELGRITVEVLNAGGREGMAREATERLRELGFDVVSFGNAREFGQEASVVLDRVEDLRAAREVARALEITDVRSEPDPNLLVDVTVRIGSGWEPAEAAAGRDPGPGDAAPWWDLRRLLPRDAADGERGEGS